MNTDILYKDESYPKAQVERIVAERGRYEYKDPNFLTAKYA